MRHIPIADYRNYYEELSLARRDLRSQRQKEIENNKVQPPASLIYYREFKTKLYCQIAAKAPQFSNDSRVLDIGCGCGEDLPHIRSSFTGTIYSIDISMNQLLMAADTLKDDKSYRFTQSYAEQIPFKSASFDCVIFSEIIEHLPHPELALREIYRILKPDGYLFITTPNKYSYFHLFGQLFPPKIRRWLSMKLKGIQWDVDSSKFTPHQGMKEHISLFSLFSLSRLLKKEGLKVEKVIGGMLECPFPYLFDRYPFLVRCWSFLDRLLEYPPFSVYLKANFIVVARKF